MDDDLDRDLTPEEQILWDILPLIAIDEDDPNFDEAYWVERGMQVVRGLMAKMSPFEPAPEASPVAWW